MRLAAPLTAPSEAAVLAEAGASEFYCGVQDEAWQSRFGNHDSISRRQGGANLASLAQLEEVLAETRAVGAPLFLTLNGSYSQAQMPLALEYARWFEQRGGAGVMVADLGLLALLRQGGSNLTRGVSVLAGISSPAALQVCQSLGAGRVVLPRHLAPGQMAEVLAACPGMEAEALVWLDKCPFIDGLCRFVHSVGYVDAPAGQLPPPGAEPLYAYDMDYRLPACFGLCGKPPATPACAACHLLRLREAGVAVFKMGGRGRSLETRLAGARFLRRAWQMLEEAESAEATETCGAAAEAQRAARCKAAYREAFGAPCGNDVCYYGAAGQP